MDIEIIKKQQQQAIKTIEDNKKKLNENAERLNAIDNHMRFNNLEIHGVPCKENENINDVAMKILKAVDTSINQEDIQTVQGNSFSDRTEFQKCSPLCNRF